MRRGTGSGVSGWLLLCSLALGLVLMHHAPASEQHMGTMSPPVVASATVSAPAMSPSDGSGRGESHVLMHMCLAVIGAFGAVLALVGAFLGLPRRFGADGGPPARVGLFRTDRPPGGGRTVLTSLCVLRL
ncbi:hypothetical protein [Gandjariella thermophila]|uniref:hypothetical protein n=1 Tax=Gandjariella thermophila TaxID=1931992 RepID=UPI001CEFAF25|nr:hypothetical protein [Gandjariella thermophila]